MSMGDTTTRFGTTISRRRKGWNMGASGSSTDTSKPLSRTCLAKVRSTAATKSGARRRRLS
jgi:hypothetical protein